MPKYNVIYLDPPWGFKTYSKPEGQVPQRAKVQHYPTMTMEELKALPVANYASDQCAVVMWVLDSMLPEALDLGAHYGFKFKCVLFVWDKESKSGGEYVGMGKYTRKGTELCLLFTTKKPPKVKSHKVRQMRRLPIREHSRKPDEFRTDIEELFDGPYLEMFARSRAPGWAAWGNEVGKFVSVLQDRDDDDSL